MVSYDVLAEAVIKGDGSAVETEVKRVLGENADPKEVLEKGLTGGMEVVGERFGAGDMFLPEVIACAAAMHQGLAIILPLLEKLVKKARGCMVIGTVEGDIHDIGKRIVGSLIEGNGYKVIDLGVDVKAEDFAQAVEEYEPDFLGLSALLTTTMLKMGEVIDCLKKKGLRNKVKIIVGGAVVTEQFAESIGADGFAPDAVSAVASVKKF